MIRVCFVCLGNICRSPMAEFIMKEKLRVQGLMDQFIVESRATSYEEDGNDMYPLAKRKLDEMGIPYEKHRATRLEKGDYSRYDYFVCMDESNIRGVKRIFSEDISNVFMLLNRNIADPWYTGDFTTTYIDLDRGIDNLIEQLLDNKR